MKPTCNVIDSYPEDHVLPENCRVTTRIYERVREHHGGGKLRVFNDPVNVATDLAKKGKEVLDAVDPNDLGASKVGVNYYNPSGVSVQFRFDGPTTHEQDLQAILDRKTERGTVDPGGGVGYGELRHDNPGGPGTVIVGFFVTSGDNSTFDPDEGLSHIAADNASVAALETYYYSKYGS